MFPSHDPIAESMEHGLAGLIIMLCCLVLVFLIKFTGLLATVIRYGKVIHSRLSGDWDRLK